MYISKYTFFVIYLWVEKNSHFLKNLTLFLEGIGIFQYREVCESSSFKTKSTTPYGGIFWKYNWKRYENHIFH